jgi:hypothetical protein
MPTNQRTTDSLARLVLPPSFANATVLIEQTSEDQIRVRRLNLLANEDLPFTEEITAPLSDRDHFLNLLADPPAPNPRIQAAAVRHRARHG